MNFRPVSWMFITVALLFNLVAMVHLQVIKRNSSSKLLETMGSQQQQHPQFPNANRLSMARPRYNPTLMQGISESFILAFMLGVLVVLMKIYPINKLSLLYLMQLSSFLLFVATLCVCFMTKESLRKHIWMTLCLKRNSIVPYTTRN